MNSPEMARQLGTRTAAGGSQARSILLVDSNSVHRKRIAAEFEEAGFQVIRAASCHEALSICRQSLYPIAALVTKTELPDMTGINLARAARRLRASLPVIYISDRTEDFGSIGGELIRVPSVLGMKTLIQRVSGLLTESNRIPPASAETI